MIYELGNLALMVFTNDDPNERPDPKNSPYF